MAESRGGRQWLKYGCGGCLAVLLLGAVATGIVLAVVFIGGQPGTVEERVLTPEVPATSAVEAAPVEPAPGEAARPPAGTAGPGRVILDVQQAEFFVEPGPTGEPLQVEARYDRESCELRETLDPDGEPGWVYHLQFSCEQRSFLQSMRSLLGGKKERVRVLLPPDQPLALEVRGSQGGSILELGGLWLTSLEVDFAMGGLILGVEDPLREPLDSMVLHGEMGGLVATGLGNASPRRLVVDYRMGGMELDLRGRWLTDSDIDIDLRMGGGSVTLPRGVLIEGVPSGISTPTAGPEIKPPTLRFTTNTVQGGLEFSD
jgi:hypothetical protein